MSAVLSWRWIYAWITGIHPSSVGRTRLHRYWIPGHRDFESPSGPVEYGIGFDRRRNHVPRDGIAANVSRIREAQAPVVACFFPTPLLRDKLECRGGWKREAQARARAASRRSRACPRGERLLRLPGRESFRRRAVSAHRSAAPAWHAPAA